VASSAREFRHLATQTSLIAGAGGIVVVVVALAFGQSLLGLIGGEAFEGGVAILVPLALAASFDLASVAFEPVLHSLGQAQLSLTARIVALGMLGLGMVLFIHLGPSGAAWDVALAAAALYIVMGATALITLRRIGHHDSRLAEIAPAGWVPVDPAPASTSELAGAAHGVTATATRDPTSD